MSLIGPAGHYCPHGLLLLLFHAGNNCYLHGWLCPLPKGSEYISLIRIDACPLLDWADGDITGPWVRPSVLKCSYWDLEAIIKKVRRRVMRREYRKHQTRRLTPLGLTSLVLHPGLESLALPCAASVMDQSSCLEQYRCLGCHLI